MSDYIDGFVFPIPRAHLDSYKKVAEKVAAIWKEHGASEYMEFAGDDLYLEGTRSFVEAVGAHEGEVVIFGWVVFPSRAIRDLANKNVPADPRMSELVGPLVHPERLVFDASRMVYGGFRALVVE